MAVPSELATTAAHSPQRGDEAVDVVVIGMGYVGLPLAQAATRAGLRVTGYDVVPAVVQALNEGRSHIDDLSDADIDAMRAGGFVATTDPSVLALAQTIVICVPTPLTPEGGPDLTAVLGATGAIAGNLQPGQLIVLESTTYPGTTDDEVRPVLEESGLVAGRDFHLAFSPERIDPGNPTFGMRNTPKVVGGHTEECTQVAATFYGHFVDTVVRAKGTREAEMAKLLENTYRHINIALVNEMARFCHELDIDLWDVIAAAKSKPFGFQAFYPGPGVGGHCIPIDPNYLSYQVQAKLGYPFRFVELAQEINAGMPAYVVRRIQDLLNDDRKPLSGARVCLLGVTYKPDIADQRESPAKPIAQQLIDKGAQVVFHDPHVRQWRVGEQVLTVEDDVNEAVAEADICVLLQNHRDYDADSLSAAAHVLLDTRGVTTHPKAVRL